MPARSALVATPQRRAVDVSLIRKSKCLDRDLRPIGHSRFNAAFIIGAYRRVGVMSIDVVGLRSWDTAYSRRRPALD